MPTQVFRNREDAGRVLATRLEHYHGSSDVVVLGLPRGGVPVAYEVASALRAPLDVYVVRKLGAPGAPEVAVGAVASGDVLVTNDETLRAAGVTAEQLEQLIDEQRNEVHRREQSYRGDQPPVAITGRTAIVVDDGLATGATMSAALQGVRKLDPQQVVAAVPAAPSEACQELSHTADDVVCVMTPRPFVAVGAAYVDFEQTSDADVRRLLTEPTGPGATG